MVNLDVGSFFINIPFDLVLDGIKAEWPTKTI